jgi:hypothetical protein
MARYKIRAKLLHHMESGKNILIICHKFFFHIQIRKLFARLYLNYIYKRSDPERIFRIRKEYSGSDAEPKSSRSDRIRVLNTVQIFLAKTVSRNYGKTKNVTGMPFAAKYEAIS